MYICVDTLHIIYSHIIFTIQLVIDIFWIYGQMKVINDKKKNQMLYNPGLRHWIYFQRWIWLLLKAQWADLNRYISGYQWHSVEKKNASSVSFRELSISKHDSAHSYWEYKRQNITSFTRSIRLWGRAQSWRREKLNMFQGRNLNEIKKKKKR